MRLRSRLAPGAGASECSPTVSGSTGARTVVGSSAIVLDLHQVGDGVELPAQLRGVLALDGLADAAQAERAHRVALLLVRPVLGLGLRDLDRHQTVVSASCT